MRVSEDKAYDLYNEMLDETYENYHIGELSWTASQILAELDPTAYRCGFNDWLDAEDIEIEED